MTEESRLYNLTLVRDREKTDREILSEFRGTYVNAHNALTSGGSDNNQIDWSTHHHELQALSLKYPTIVFKLMVMTGDRQLIGVKYYKSGKCQVAQALMTFEPFDENKLV